MDPALERAPRGGRKINYARLLVDALETTRVPRPLDRLLAHL